MPAVRSKPRPIRVSEALSRLPAEQQAAIRSGPNQQRFRNALRGVTLGRTARPRAIPGIAKRAAMAALHGFSFRAVPERPKRNVINTSRPLATEDLGSFNVKKMKGISASHDVLFPSGHRMRFVAELGPPLLGFEHLQKPFSLFHNDFPGPVVRVHAKPIVSKGREPNLYATLQHPVFGHGMSTMCIKFHRLRGSGRSVMVVWTADSHRLFGLGRLFKKRYKGREMAQMAYLEAIARNAGCEKMAVISPEHVDLMEQIVPMDYENVKEQYEQLKRKLEKEGFSPQKLKVEPLKVKRMVYRRGGYEDITTKHEMPEELAAIPFLVKELN